MRQRLVTSLERALRGVYPHGERETMGKQNFGNSLLPSHDSNTHREQVTRFGILKVIPWPETEQHALMYEDTRKLGFSMLAIHPNGYSCKELANRIIEAWEKRGTAEYALKQFDYILDCGGLGKKRSAIEWIINQS